MPASTKTPSPAGLADSRWLIGRLAEHRELDFRLSERTGLLVIEADPLSGTSALLALTLDAIDRPVVRVDARGAGDAMDLAMAIADAAVPALAPIASAWWSAPLNLYDPVGLRLAHRLAPIHIEDLRQGAGARLDRLREALELVATLGEDNVLLAIDHLDTLLERLSEHDARELLAVIRAARQRKATAEMLLVGRTEGRLARSLRDPRHALYRAGDVLTMTRAKPKRFIDDLAIGKPRADAPAALIATAAELANGCPAYVWQIVDHARRIADEPQARALTAWQALREQFAAQTAQYFETLASAQRAAPSVVCAISCGLAPYSLPINDKSVNVALNRLRARGVLFSPRPRKWAVSDPLLAAWARDHAPSGIRRRASAIPG